MTGSRCSWRWRRTVWLCGRHGRADLGTTDGAISFGRGDRRVPAQHLHGALVAAPPKASPVIMPCPTHPHWRSVCSMSSSHSPASNIAVASWPHPPGGAIGVGPALFPFQKAEAAGEIWRVQLCRLATAVGDENAVGSYWLGRRHVSHLVDKGL